MKRLIVIAALLAGCQSTGDSGQMEEAMPAVPPLADYVLAATDDWNMKWSAGNGAGFGEAYADDAILYAPNAEPISGKAAISEFWGGAVASGLQGRIETIESGSDGSVGFETGMYHITDSTGADLDYGSYVVVWKYVDGAWKMYRDIWNTNVAAPAPEM